MSSNWFAQLVVSHPYIILSAVTVFSGTCLVLPFTLKALPQFSDPQSGFETRGTSIANRLTSWRNLIEETGERGKLVVNPKAFHMRKKIDEQAVQKKLKKERKAKKKQKLTGIVINKEPRNYTANSTDNWLTLVNIVNTQLNSTKRKFVPVQKEGFFCGPPDEKYTHLVFESVNGLDLFNLKSILAMCRIEHEFIQAKYYKDLCVHTATKPPKCCRPWSLGNHIALLRNRTSCLALTEEDVNATRSLLQNCSQYYHSLKLTSDCSEKRDCNIPMECVEHNAVYNILNYLTDTSFLPPNKSTEVTLRETMLFLPIACSTATLNYYYEIQKLSLEYEGVSVVAMEFGIKSALFDQCLLRDAWLMSSGGLFVLFCMWLYTGSLFLTIMTIIAIVFSLGISYFMYTLVFELSFFPFMNLMATVVAVGIGADAAFVFVKMWETAKREKTSSVVELMSETFQHAFFSVFVTSLTTAVAFLASYVSSITAIACFSIFAGVAVLSNCFLMISWFPACIVALEISNLSNYNLIRSCLMACLQRLCCYRFFQPPRVLPSSWFKCKCSFLVKVWNAKERFVFDNVLNFRFFWLVLLSLLAVASAIIVLYYPKLELPSSPEFQLFESSHPFETYDLIYKHKFWFKRIQKDNIEMSKMMLRFVWGIKPVDNGNYLDPASRGTLNMDSTFDMSHPKSQAWLLQFCRRLRQQPFYQGTLGPLLPNCFIESFTSWMKRRCFDTYDDVNRMPCCEVDGFPYNSSIFNTCIVEAIADLYETPAEYFIPGVAGPKFSKDQNPTIKVIVIEYFSNYTYSMSYNHVHEFYTRVENWMREELKTAPDTMKNGWFVSDLDFYDLQRELSEGTLMAIAMSMGLAFVVLLVSTLNILTSLYAIITITFSILVTMAVLVLLGWKLNVLESVAVSTAIGLTVDFSLHYTVNYRMCPPDMAVNRESATRYALRNMAGPACMAAITTGAVGAFMMPSLVLAYIQIGIFLVIVMAVSWFYATFHLGSLLAIAGPQNQFGQFSYAGLFCCSFGSKKTASEFGRDRPATSSISDTHELDSLTSKSGTRPVPRALQRSMSGGKSNLNKYIFTDQSPSATSAITIITTEDN